MTGPLRVARIDATHGLRGEVSARPLTDFPDRFGDLGEVAVGRQPGGRRLRLEAWRPHRGKVLLKFAGVDDVGAARGLRGCDVWVDGADAVRLPPGTYYHRDLIGLQVRVRDGRAVGRVRDVLVTGGTDVLVVAAGEREILVPAARSICVEIDPAAGSLVIDPPEGLLDLNAG
jgi:16S rRNA processing protein RimM